MALRYAEAASESYDYPLLIGQLLKQAKAGASTQKIVYSDKHSYSYAQFVERVGRLASFLNQLGAEQGSTVAVMDWDSHRYLEAYFAIPMMGAVLQPVNVRLPAAQIAYTLEHAKAEILLVHHDFFPLAEAMLPSLPGIKAVVAIMDGEEGALPEWSLGEYEALSDGASPDYPFTDFDENAVATTFYTSGTTGDPKAVCFTHRQLVLHCLVGNGPFGSSREAPGFGYDDVYMPLTPMFHVHAWGMPYVATMLGVKQVYPGRYEPDLICKLRRDHAVTFSHCVPTILQMVLAAAEQTGTDLEGWTMIIGGSALTRASCSEARQRGMDIIAGYGMSETAPLISIARPPKAAPENEDDLLRTLVAAGIPVPLVEARIVDEHMHEVPHDGKSWGELVLRAPWLTPCYVGNEKASKALWRGGWMHTQDIATIDADGTIRIRDRLKDVIKTGGEWIDSIQLEELVATAKGVAAASVIAMPDKQWGERPLAVIVPENGVQPDLAAINAPVNSAIEAGSITRYAAIEHFEMVDELPKTSVGKIDKKQLRAMFGKQ